MRCPRCGSILNARGGPIELPREPREDEIIETALRTFGYGAGRLTVKLVLRSLYDLSEPAANRFIKIALRRSREEER